MPEFTARFHLNDTETFDALVDTAEWDHGPLTKPPLVPDTLYPQFIPGSDVEGETESTFWDYQYLADDGVPVYKYRTLVH